MVSNRRRSLIVALASFACGIAAAPALAQPAYPTRPVRLVVP